MNTSLINSCSFFGHRTIEITTQLKTKLKEYLIDLIKNKRVERFLFGGFGEFDDLCYKLISELKKQYSHIKRIFCLSDIKHTNFFKRPKWLKKETYEEFVYLSFFDY